MQTELYSLVKRINVKNLNQDDKEELLRFFMATRNSLIRNHISLIFADLNYDKAVPFIIKKINSKSTYNNNATLVYSLGEFNLKKYFIPLIKIICKQEYESRLIAFGLIQKLVGQVSNKTKIKALDILKQSEVLLQKQSIDKGENSALHFIEKTQELLE